MTRCKSAFVPCVEGAFNCAGKLSVEGWWEGGGRNDDAKGADLLYDIMHPPLCANVVGMRASGSMTYVVDVVLCAWMCV